MNKATYPDPGNPNKERCYRCHRPFPARKVIELGKDGQAVIKVEPDVHTALVWGIPNRQLAVPVCRSCAGVRVTAEDAFRRAELIVRGVIVAATIQGGDAA